MPSCLPAAAWLEDRVRRIIVLALAVSACSAHAAGLVSLYTFEDTLAPVVNATGKAQDLEFRTGGLPTSAAGPVTYSDETVGSGSKRVANFTAPQFFRARHGIGKNGGGEYVNQYTILMDVKFTSAGWASFFNTTADNGNDGDAFINPSDAIGISGTYAGSFQRNRWNRLAMTVDLSPAVNKIRLFVDGAFQNEVGLSGLDGRWALYAWDGPDVGIEHVDIFGDNNGENASGQIGMLAFYDGALNDGEISGLGSAGQPVPEPATLAALGVGGLLLLRRRAKR